MSVLDVYAIERRLKPSGWLCGLLSAEQALELWPQIAVELEKVRHVWEKQWTLESLQNGVLEQGIQLWAVGPKESVRMFLFSYVAQYPTDRALRCFLMFGTGLREGLPILMASLHRFCLVRGCSRAEVVGRKGWEAELKPFGFELLSVVLSVDVQQERVH